MGVVWASCPHRPEDSRLGSRVLVLRPRRSARVVSEDLYGRPRGDGVSGPHALERKDGKTGSRCVLRARAGSRRGQRGRPVFKEPVLGAADGERRDRPGVRGVLLAVPEASMSAAGASLIVTSGAKD